MSKFCKNLDGSLNHERLELVFMTLIREIAKNAVDRETIGHKPDRPRIESKMAQLQDETGVFT